MAIETLISDVKTTVKKAKQQETKRFSPAYKVVEDYFNPNPLTTRTCTMSRISKKLSYYH